MQFCTKKKLFSLDAIYVPKLNKPLQMDLFSEIYQCTLKAVSDKSLMLKINERHISVIWLMKDVFASEITDVDYLWVLFMLKVSSVMLIFCFLSRL